jgi:F-type H+-transporting ATPase subunit b
MSMLCLDLTLSSVAPLGVIAAAGGDAVTVDIDRTVLLQAVLFAFLVWVVLKPLLFDPVLRVFALREERTDGARATARDLQQQAGTLLRKYEVELDRVHRVAAEERERVSAETAKLESEILRQARDAATATITDGRTRIEAEITAARAEIARESQNLARELARVALGREVQ